jgi:hypothetical protein
MITAMRDMVEMKMDECGVPLLFGYWNNRRGRDAKILSKKKNYFCDQQLKI